MPVTDPLEGFTRLELLAARAGMQVAIAVVERALANNPQASAADVLVFLSDRLAMMTV